MARQLVLTTDLAESSVIGGGGYARASSRTENRSGRGAGRGHAGRRRVRRQPLLRRSWRRLDGDGPVLRPGQETSRPPLGVDEGHLPAPDDQGPCRHVRRTRTAHPSPHESALAEVLAGIVQVDGVPVGSHFFDDLGADSMVMAQFCARVRKRADLPSVSMKDIYQHPTIKSLAAAFADSVPAPLRSPKPSRPRSPRTRRSESAAHTRRRRHHGPAPASICSAGRCSC